MSRYGDGEEAEKEEGQAVFDTADDRNVRRGPRSAHRARPLLDDRRRPFEHRRLILPITTLQMYLFYSCTISANVTAHADADDAHADADDAHVDADDAHADAVVAHADADAAHSDANSHVHSCR